MQKEKSFSSGIWKLFLFSTKQMSEFNIFSYICRAIRREFGSAEEQPNKRQNCAINASFNRSFAERFFLFFI
ncbi:hypothetical protein EDM00_11450 [Ornithobacterium rhinotracheale]|nr:hypothetical protein [Ornithobacterium rhinotracheale]